MDFEDIFTKENMVDDVKIDDGSMYDTANLLNPKEEVKDEEPKKEEEIVVVDDEPKKEEPKQEEVKETIDYKSKFSEILGEDVNEVNDDVWGKVKSIKEKNKEYESKIKEYEVKLNEKPKYSNPALARIDKLQSITNIEDISLLGKLASKDPSKMSAFEAMKTSFIVNNPELADEADIDDFILKKYGVDSIEELDDLQGSDKIKLRQDEKEAKNRLNAIYSELNKEEKDNSVELKEKQQLLSNAWASVGENVKKEIKNISIPIVVNGKHEEFMTYSANDLADYVPEMIEQLTNGGMELTEDNLKLGLGFMENRYFLDHKAEIITQAVTKAKSEIIEEYEKKYANVKPLGSNIETDSVKKPKADTSEDYIKWANG